jgi:hypothetical protein
MKRKLINLLVVTALVVCAGCAIAGDKIDVSKVITKPDAEKILGVPVKDAKGRNQNGKGGYYESEWSYRAIEGDKGSISTFSMRGETLRRILRRQCFPCCPPMAANRFASTVSVTKPSSARTRPAGPCCMFSKAIS